MASLVTQPADVVKTHMQISRSPCSTLGVARHIYAVRLGGPDSGHVCRSLQEVPSHTRLLLPLSPHRSEGWEGFSEGLSPGVCAAL